MTEQIRRASRLVRMEQLFRRSQTGLTTAEVARDLGVSRRTVERDLIVLESELGVPFMDAPGRRRRIMPGAIPVGAIRFTLHEARAVYLATRLFLRHADEQDADGISALEKLAQALPGRLGDHVAYAAAELRSRPVSPEYSRVLHLVTEAWAQSQTIALRYRSAHSRSPRTVHVDPYFLEPSATGAATYVIGYSHQHEEPRIFKLDRVISAQPTGRTFEVSGLDELRAQLAASWGGVVLGDDQYDVVLEFSAHVADRVAETHWHPSQRLVRLPGGALRFEVRLPSLLEFIPWVRGWGPEVVVVAPDELRNEVALSLRLAADRYVS